MSTGIIILAAGSSSRLGQPKQLLEYKGTTFLNRIVLEAVNFANSAVVVVTGFNRSIIDEAIKSNVLTCHNPEWEEGMASSIKTGLRHLLLVYPQLRSCIITVCDQPYLDATIFEQLTLKQQQTAKGIVACAYAESSGVPVLFTRNYFDALLHLEGQEGARKLLAKYKDDVVTVPFKKGAIDIDTIDDYNKLINL